MMIADSPENGLEARADEVSERRASTPDNAAVLASERLFDGQRVVVIEHQGERYQLRITRQGKLILTK